MPRHKNLGDDVLLNAVRQRILDEISAKQAHHAASVVNNYGGGAPAHHSAGIQEQMGGMDPELYDYMVEIGKRDLPPSEEHHGKSPGWDKTVRRYRTSADEPKGKKKSPVGHKPGFKYETKPSTREEHLRAQIGDIDPAKHAGESWFNTEEYATPEGILNPYTRGEVGKEGDYYPGPKPRRKK